MLFVQARTSGQTILMKGLFLGRGFSMGDNALWHKGQSTCYKFYQNS